MKLDLVIPTKNRKKKLDACLNSLFHSIEYRQIKDDIDIYIYFSIEEEYKEYTEFFKNVPHIIVKLLDDYRVPNFWNSHLQQTKADAMCYLNDDVILFEDTISVIFKEFQSKFPNYDGVMGVRQANLPQNQAVEGAFGVIGLKYADRFPERQVFCPDYDRFFADFEVWKYSNLIHKFYFCSIARIQHLHPVTDRNLEDETHKDVRKWISGDKRTFNLRQHRNLLWGNSFELLNKE